MKVLLLVVGIPLLLVLIVGGSYVSSRNEMVRKNETVKQTWSQVDVVLERRADLIPNLVATVKGYAQQEQKVFGDIANARAGLLNARTPAAKIAANGQLDGALGRLLAIAENYPTLKSNQNFLALQDELAGTENRIAVERLAVQRGHPGLQHLHRTVPQQHLCRMGRLPTKQRLLRSDRRRARGSQSGLQYA